MSGADDAGNTLGPVLDAVKQREAAAGEPETSATADAIDNAANESGWGTSEASPWGDIQTSAWGNDEDTNTALDAKDSGNERAATRNERSAAEGNGNGPKGNGPKGNGPQNGKPSTYSERVETPSAQQVRFSTLCYIALHLI